MKKITFKILLDVAMLLTLLLMFKKQIISMSFHEIGGLILIGAFLLHVLLNGKWVASVTAKLFDKSLPIRTKIGYLVNFLLAVCFVLIGLSGIFISKVVFHFQIQGPWKIIHYFCAALSVVLMGIHLGLHARFLCNMFNKKNPIPKTARRTIAIVVSLLIFAFGCYSMTTTNFVRFISMPFSAGSAFSMQNEGRGPMGNRQPTIPGQSPDGNSEPALPEGESEAQNEGSSAQNGNFPQQPQIGEDANKGNAPQFGRPSAPDGVLPGNGQKGDAPRGNGNGLQREGPFNKDGDFSGRGPQNGLPGDGGNHSQGFSLFSLLTLLANYFSIIFVFASITVFIEKTIRKSRPKKLTLKVKDSNNES